MQKKKPTREISNASLSRIPDDDQGSVPTQAIADDEVDELLDQFGKTLNRKRESGFRLGTVKDVNISGIEKVDDDPNQLFSVRQ
jgi:hypothetical protein